MLDVLRTLKVTAHTLAEKLGDERKLTKILKADKDKLRKSLKNSGERAHHLERNLAVVKTNAVAKEHADAVRNQVLQNEVKSLKEQREYLVEQLNLKDTGVAFSIPAYGWEDAPDWDHKDTGTTFIDGMGRRVPATPAEPREPRNLGETVTAIYNMLKERR